MDQFRYVLLCRHAPHDDGRLVAVKDKNDQWRFPTESVARALAEELVIGQDDLRLAKVICAPTPEAMRTATLLLQRFQGGTRKANDKVPKWRMAALLPQRLRGGTRGANDKVPKQPEPATDCGEVEIAAPAWLPEPDKRKRIKLGACGYNVPYEEWKQLLPNRLNQTKARAARRIDKEVERLGDGRNALLVVGHQPQLGWLSGYLSADRRPGWRSGAVPLAPSEVACLRLQKTKNSWRGSLIWTLVPDDTEALHAVADKVKGKMESAKLLSAVITIALTALLGVLLDTSKWEQLGSPRASLAGLSYSGQVAIQVAFVLLLTALALYLLTMYSYDRLLMPTRFWAEGPDRRREGERDASARSAVLQRLVERRTRGSWLPRRPPSSSAWVVLRNMQRTWFWLFTPANVLVALALAILAGALLRLHDWVWMPVALFALMVTVWAWWFRPVLGSED